MKQEQLVAQMTPLLKEKYLLFKQVMDSVGNPFLLREVLRTPQVQAAYWAQGRLELAEVNALRKDAGLAPIGASENKYQITWTHNSRHFAGADGLGSAFDIVLLKNGQPTWDTKWDSNDQDLIPEYLEAARIGHEVGLDAGGLWTKRADYPHFSLGG